MTKSKTIDTAAQEFLRSIRIVEDLTDEEWAERDARITTAKADETRRADEGRIAARRLECIDAGFPIRALDAMSGVNELAPTLVRVAKWRPEDKSLLVLSGPNGCGKTVAATWWALRQPTTPAFLRSSTFAAGSRYTSSKREAWLAANSLVLDDLGTEYADAKGSFLVDLDELIDTYYANKRPLLITTNCKREQFKMRYGARIEDRIRECGAWFSTDTNSMRGKP